MSTWRPINEAEPGAGDLLLRAGPGLLDPAYVGRQRDDGLWYFGDLQVQPTHFAEIPPFDCEPA
jgi:hypothetical protein